MQMQGTQGIPTFYWYGEEGEYNILIIELLGPSIEYLHSLCNKAFSLSTTLALLDQMVKQNIYEL